MNTLKKRWVQNTLLVLGTGAIALGMVNLDVRARAREAFRQGNTYARWHKNPEEKRKQFDLQLLKRREALERRRAKGKIAADAFEQEWEILQFDRDHALEESSIKYAAQWYKDVYELFSPPESKWVRRARFLAPAAKERWREELRAQGVPFEEYMLDLEAGEEAGTLMVYSTRRREEAQRCLEALKAQGINAHLYDAPAQGRLPQEGLKIIVPRETFWEAHQALVPVVDPPLPGEAAL